MLHRTSLVLLQFVDEFLDQPHPALATTGKARPIIEPAIMDIKRIFIVFVLAS
jgi:hypothetical protein